MPADSPEWGSLPFDEAIQFFRGKLNVSTAHWDDLWQAAHDRAFTVAGAAGDALLADLRDAVDAAIAAGTTLEQFRKDFGSIVLRHGWTGWTGEGDRAGVAWRTEIIYGTNCATAYAAGRWTQLSQPDLVARMPYRLYRHSDSVAHPRPLHLSWDGLVLRHDDPWWQTHTPPNGWGCKCTVFAISARDLRALGKRGPDTAPDDGSREWTNRRTGEVHVVPNGIDPGWDYAPGASGPFGPGPAPRPAPTPPTPPVNPWDSATDAGAWHDHAWGDAPEWLRAAVGRTRDAPVQIRPGAGSHSSAVNGIQMGYANDGGGKSQDVWRHEFGHWIDQCNQLVSAGPRFTAAIQKDAKALLADAGLGRGANAAARAAEIQASRGAVVDELLQQDPETRAATLRSWATAAGIEYDAFAAWCSQHGYVSTLPEAVEARLALEARALRALTIRDPQGFLDAIDGVQYVPGGTRNRVESYRRGTAASLSDLLSAATRKRVEGCGAHSAAYYAKWRPLRNMEAWANVVAVLGTGVIGRALLERFVPEMLGAVEEFMKNG